MQTSRVNGLTSGVFAFLEPASCLNQKGSGTRRDNITFPVADYYLHFPVFIAETPGAGKNLLFPVSGVGQLSNAKASVLPQHLFFHRPVFLFIPPYLKTVHQE
ncbi:hypothetical protein ACFVGB_004367 [Salmonella enterica]